MRTDRRTILKAGVVGVTAALAGCSYSNNAEDASDCSDLEEEIEDKEQRIEELQAQLPDTDGDAPVIQNLFLEQYDEDWVYIGRRFEVPRHDPDEFYVMEHLTITGMNDQEIYTGKEETRVTVLDESEERETVSPSWWGVSRNSYDLPSGEYEVTLEVEDTNIDQWSEPETITINL